MALTPGKNVALYWGQNSFGDQQPLGYYCDSDDFDIVIVSFLNDFPELGLNLANQCGDTFSSGLLHCPAVGADIKTCQQKGKTVLLSLGGIYGTYGFNDDQEGEDFATVLWNKFGGGSDDERPFDDAVVDGFDFDFENQNQVGTVAFATALRALYAEDPSKQYYLSASPQCVYPDASVGDVLANVPLDFAFIQFYNNVCSLDGSFNWDAWQLFAETAPNPDIQLFVGLPGGPSSATSGYVDLATVEEQVNDSILSSCNFGGFLLWDASSATNNVNAAGEPFYEQLNDYLDLYTGPRCVSSSSSSATTSTTSTTSSIPSAFYPLFNSSSTGTVDDSTVVKTTVIREIYTTVCPNAEGEIVTSVVTNIKTVTYTGECECTKQHLGTTTVAPPQAKPTTVAPGKNGDVFVTVTSVLYNNSTIASQSSSVPLVLSTYEFNGSSKVGASLLAVLLLSLAHLF